MKKGLKTMANNERIVLDWETVTNFVIDSFVGRKKGYA